MATNNYLWDDIQEDLMQEFYDDLRTQTITYVEYAESGSDAILTGGGQTVTETETEKKCIKGNYQADKGFKEGGFTLGQTLDIILDIDEEDNVRVENSYFKDSDGIKYSIQSITKLPSKGVLLIRCQRM